MTSDIKILPKVMLCGLKKCKINRGYSNHGSALVLTDKAQICSISIVGLVE